MRKQLTEAMIEKQGAPATGRLEIFDTFTPGLALRVSAGGAKTFVVRARIRGEASPIRVTVGRAAPILVTYPGETGKTLKDIRAVAGKVLEKCALGEDPRPKPEPVAEPPADLRWEAVVETFIEKHAKRNRSWPHTKALLAQRTGGWNAKLIGEITRADVVAMLDEAEKTSVYVANRALAAVRKLFNWAVLRGLVDATPIVAGMARAGEVSRARFLAFEEIRLVWRACDRIGQPFGPLFKQLVVVGQRRGEVLGMKWPSLELETERLWTLTAEETKAERAHIVPLTDLAVSILDAQPRIDDPDLAEEARARGLNRPSAVYVFTTTGKSPLSGLSKAKTQLDAAMLDILREDAEAAGLEPESVKPLPSWRVHDLRRTVATHMEDALGVPPHIVGSVLNHSPGSYKGVTAVYTRGSLIYERRRALVAWSRLLALAVAGGSTWATIAQTLRPETEADAARTDEFRRMAQADEESWTAYLARINGRPEAIAA